MLMGSSLLCMRYAQEVAMTGNSQQNRDEVFLEYTKASARCARWWSMRR
jgi:hypothetical protein